jgi:hypothetical protein
MMDGIQQNPNVSDDALDAWHEHVIEVEQAADAVLTGEATNLIFIRADGLALEFAVPQLPCFARFLAWMQRQVNMRSILPADTSLQLEEATLFFNRFIAELAAAVRSADADTLVFSRQISVADFITLQTHAANRMLEVPRRSSVVISELDDNSGSSLASSESDALNSDLAQLGFITESQSISTGNAPVLSDAGLSDRATYENDQSAFSEGSSSLIPLPDQPAVSRTGRAKKKNTSHVETQVRRSPRLHNNGVFVSLPNSTRRRASSVPRASPLLLFRSPKCSVWELKSASSIRPSLLQSASFRIPLLKIRCCVIF